MAPQNLPPHPQLRTAVAAADVAGEILKSYFRGTFNVHVKDGPDVVTQADLDAEKAILARIREEYPDDQFLAEESARDAVESPRLWIIDPVDGTTNFLHGVPQFAVSIAYYESGRPVCGVVYNPILGDWYTALAGSGAWYNDEPARVSAATELEKALLATGFYYDRGPLMEGTVEAVREVFRRGVHCVRRMGAASLDLAYVGTGRFGAYFEYLLSPWDFAAGRLFVEEAGGRVTDCLGAPLPMARTHILATNGPLHGVVQEIAGKHLPAASRKN